MNKLARIAGIVLTLTTVLALESSAQRQSQRVTEEPGLDRRGNDYTSFNARELRDCTRACERDSRCLAYTYDNFNERCWLKDRVNSASRNGNMTTGVKEGSDWQQGPGRGDLTEERGLNYYGGQYTEFGTRNLRSCQDECRRDPRCRVYTYNVRTSLCYLKERGDNPRRDDDTISGEKRSGSSSGSDWGSLTEEWGYDYKGGDYTNLRVRDARECKSTCQRSDRCRGYTFATQTGICYLKDRIYDRKRDADKVTGLKERSARPY